VKVVLLHALPLDERMWEGQRSALAGHDVDAPKLYELGTSMDEWAGAILDRVEGRFAAVGASMGGYCALAIARRAPERLAGLLLAGSRAEADPPDRAPVRNRWIERIAEEGAAGLWAEMGPAVFGSLTGDLAERVRSLALEQDPEGLINALTAIRDREDTRDAVAALPSPLVVALGSADPLVPVDVARELAASAPNGRVEVFDGAGHLPNLEQPERFNTVLTDFVGSLS
jgi:pimeloyl-ACP methyl ester carboxylesterase